MQILIGEPVKGTEAKALGRGNAGTTFLSSQPDQSS
jgi:hypothetical protein